MQAAITFLEWKSAEARLKGSKNGRKNEGVGVEGGAEPWPG